MSKKVSIFVSRVCFGVSCVTSPGANDLWCSVVWCGCYELVNGPLSTVVNGSVCAIVCHVVLSNVVILRCYVSGGF